MSAHTPLSLPQVKALLAAHNLEVVDGSGESLTFHAHNANYILTLEDGDSLRFYGQWNGTTADSELFRRMRRLVSHCNSTRVTPKAYLWPQREAGRYGIAAEATLLTRAGLTEAQFFNFFEGTFTAVAQFFWEAERTLPQLVTWGNSHG